MVAGFGFGLGLGVLWCVGDCWLVVVGVVTWFVVCFLICLVGSGSFGLFVLCCVVCLFTIRFLGCLIWLYWCWLLVTCFAIGGFAGFCGVFSLLFVVVNSVVHGMPDIHCLLVLLVVC